MFTVDEELCTGCSLCLESCPSGAIRMQGQTAEIIQGLCTSCGSCAESCPQGAIYEYEELPAPRTAGRPLAEPRAEARPVSAIRARPLLAREQKVAVAAVLVPALYRLIARFAGRGSARPVRGSGVSTRWTRAASRASRGSARPARGSGVRGGGHRWRGGR